MARSYKRDLRGRFSRTGGSGSKKTVAKKKTSSHAIARKAVQDHRAKKNTITPEEAARRAKIAKNIRVARAGILVGAAAYSVYGGSPSVALRHAHSMNMGARISHANTRGLGSMIIANQSRKGVYKVTSL